VFTVASLVLFVLRSSDLTAQLSVLALALSGVAGGGPLLGAEQVFPLGTWKVLTVFTWLAGPLAFPIIALAIAYFPSPSPLLKRHRWLNAVPFLAAAPMLGLATATALYLVGVDALRDLALWDAAHPGAYYGSFALALAINVAAIVEGVLHRDLKPENILLPGGEIEAKVLDFGVAKLLGDRDREDSGAPAETQAALTMVGTIVGTPAYMAPEQLSAAALDARTDVFALGVIADEMLCGDLPFSRGSLTDVILAQARGAQPLTERDPGIPAALDRAVRRALDMAPEERPPTAHAFASDVLQALGAAI